MSGPRYFITAANPSRQPIIKQQITNKTAPKKKTKILQNTN